MQFHQALHDLRMLFGIVLKLRFVIGEIAKEDLGDLAPGLINRFVEMLSDMESVNHMAGLLKPRFDNLQVRGCIRFKIVLKVICMAGLLVMIRLAYPQIVVRSHLYEQT